MRQKMLKSMSLKQFLTTMQAFGVKGEVQDDILIDRFLEVIEEEKLLVSGVFG
jgi:hypothetical protein